MSVRNSYQRIVRDGEILQRGAIDTQVKFSQLVQGVSLRGRSVLDVGCNLGEMCYLAREAGAATVRGIDMNPEYIADARRLNPSIPFDVKRAERATGSWDYVIASGMLHYCGDLDQVLAQLARVTKEAVLCDVWLAREHKGEKLSTMTYRGLVVPNVDMFHCIVRRHFNIQIYVGDALSPDDSYRRIYHLEKPLPKPAAACVLFGRGGSGKTTRARELAAGKGYEHLELDSIFLDWRINVERSESLSVSDFVDELWSSDNDSRIAKYLAFHSAHIRRWLGAREHLDVVIEGYDAAHPTYRNMLKVLLDTFGWPDATWEDSKTWQQPQSSR